MKKERKKETQKRKKREPFTPQDDRRLARAIFRNEKQIKRGSKGKSMHAIYKDLAEEVLGLSSES